MSTTATPRKPEKVIACLFGGLVGASLALILVPLAGGPAWYGNMIIGGVLGALVGAFLIKRPAVFTSAVVGAAVVGGVSFAAGFFGPMLLGPDSPQGPLIGIFITGPIGFAIGGVIGLIVGLVRESRSKTGR